MTEASNAKISEYDFIVRAIKKLRKPPYKGIHSVYSGFNRAFREYFNKSPVELTNQLARKGKISIRPSKGGVMLYLPEDVPSSASPVLQKKLAAAMQTIHEKIRELIHPEIPAQQLAIYLLVMGEPGLSQSEIAQRLQMPQGSVSRNIAKLSQKIQMRGRRQVDTGYGLVVNEPDPTETRRHLVFPTDHGRNVFAELTECALSCGFHGA